jgi:hypothetical protein
MSSNSDTDSTSKLGVVTYNCDVCRKWLTQRVTDYENGERIVNFKTEPGKGLCEVLNTETDYDFGCKRFEFGLSHIEVMGRKSGSPWHHSEWGVCPDCKDSPAGPGWGCRRCAGTGRVLYYDDGFVGEEQTRRHPEELKFGKPPPPACIDCGKDIDLNWIACPFCGTRTSQLKPAEPVRLTSLDDGFMSSNNPRS